MDHPDGFRKLQKRPVPRLGGLAVYAAFFCALSAGALVPCKHGRPAIDLAGSEVWALFLGGTASVLLGAWDDVRGLRARWKLLALAGISCAMYAAGYRIDAVSTPFGAPLQLGVLAFPVTVFWFLGCMNAMNLIDGLDGLATGVCACVATTVLIASLMFGNTTAAVLSSALVGASLGFLVFNFTPASIFLGDSGSYLLGFLIASIGLRGAEKSSTVVALTIPLIAVGLPVMDTALAILRRWSRALPLSTCDRQHIHHKLLNAGFSQRQAVLLMYVGCIVLASFALLLTATRNVKAGGLLLVFGIAVIATVRAVGRSEINMTKKRLKAMLRLEKRGADLPVPPATAGKHCGSLPGESEPSVESVQHGESIESVWMPLTDVRDEMEVDLGKAPIPRRMKKSQGRVGSGRL